MGILNILGGSSKISQEFSWSKFIFNLFLFVVMIIGLFNSKNQFDLVYEQGILIEKSIISAEQDRSDFRKQHIETSQKLDSLVAYFETIKGRVGRERENFFLLVSVEINELRKSRALLYEILEMSESDLLAKHKIKLEKDYEKYERAYQYLVRASKKIEVLNNEQMDFWDAVKMNKEHNLLTKIKKKPKK